MNKPPKRWWSYTVEKLKKLPHISSPAKVAGWLWYHHLTPQQKILHLTKKDLQREIAKYYNGIGHGPACTDKDTQGEPMKKAKRKSKAKRRTSKKQLAALKKGRKTLKYLRTGRKVSEAKQPIILKEGELMAKGKKSSKKVVYYKGEFGGGKKRKYRKSHALHGELGGLDPAALFQDLAGGLSGALAGGILAALLPIKNAFIKALIPIAGGFTILAIPAAAKVRFLNRAGIGSLVIGSASIFRTLLPKVPLLSGMESAEGMAAQIEQLPEEERALLGVMPSSETAGLVPSSETAGQDEYAEGEEYEDQSGAFVPEEAPLSPGSM